MLEADVPVVEEPEVDVPLVPLPVGLVVSVPPRLDPFPEVELLVWLGMELGD